jgi:hypothetical protein
MVLVLLQDGYADIAGLEALRPEPAELPLKVAARTDRADREYFAWEIAALLAASGVECLEATGGRAKAQLPGKRSPAAPEAPIRERTFARGHNVGRRSGGPNVAMLT